MILLNTPYHESGASPHSCLHKLFFVFLDVESTINFLHNFLKFSVYLSCDKIMAAYVQLFLLIRHLFSSKNPIYFRSHGVRLTKNTKELLMNYFEGINRPFQVISNLTMAEMEFADFQRVVQQSGKSISGFLLLIDFSNIILLTEICFYDEITE